MLALSLAPPGHSPALRLLRLRMKFEINIAADHLAGHRAKEALNPHAARRVQEVDRVATEVNEFLAFRAEEQLQKQR